MTDKLKPCPFCGGEVRIVRCITYQDGFYWAIEGALGDNGCECNVTMESQLFDDDEHGEFEKKQLIKAWNRRAGDQE